MTQTTRTDAARRGRRRRIIVWSVAAALLLLPLVAMQFTDEVKWDAVDFVVFGAMLAGAGASYEFAMGSTRTAAYRAALVVALATAFFLVWSNLAVGFIGDGDRPANLLFFGVPAIGLIGAGIARLQPRGMAAAMLATALAQALVAVVAVILAADAWRDILMLTGFFIVPWLASAWLFQKAAREQVVVG